MTDIAVNVVGMGKEYRVGRREGNRTFRESLVDLAKLPLRMLRGGRQADQKFWALRDVSFDIKQGECVGIIGRNGAGKSTLLKLLSAITEPTEGHADVYGRVGSLLEVGTGFHKELSGRDNIFLNGSILGMRRAEIRKHFDEIVAFSEVEKFLDTPVKHYSSGMYMRLAFAVAAHLEPEVLVVDEVLAVGDAAFQKKCLGKMGQVAKSGRTVLFVSHNMAAVQSLCQRAVLLEKGRVVKVGAGGDVVRDYMTVAGGQAQAALADRTDRTGDGSARLTGIRIEDADGRPAIGIRSRLKITMSYESDRALLHPGFLVQINDLGGTPLFGLNSDFTGGLPETMPPCGETVCITDPINLTPGRCTVDVELFKGLAPADEVRDAASFDVEGEDIYGTGKSPGRDWVLCAVPHKWSVA